MNSLEALILGLIQGLTEFLPVSSSGHLAIGKALFGIHTADLSFEVAVHAATVLATIVVFRKEILQLLSGLFKLQYNSETKYILMIAVSMIPVFVVGVFFKDYVESIFGSGLIVVGGALIVTSILLALSEYIPKHCTKGGEGKPVTYKSAFIIGIAQAIAVIPGLSRSGSTIATGLLCGVKKSEVAQFSFLMVLVPIIGETFLDAVSGEFAMSSVGGLQLAIGFVAAFVSGLFACRFMIAIVKLAKLKWFALYCFIIGLASLICTLCGVL